MGRREARPLGWSVRTCQRIVYGCLGSLGLFSDNPPHLRILLFWTTLVTRGSFGVIIILLAELVHALRGDDLGYKDDYGDEDPAGET